MSIVLSKQNPLFYLIWRFVLVLKTAINIIFVQWNTFFYILYYGIRKWYSCKLDEHLLVLLISPVFCTSFLWVSKNASSVMFFNCSLWCTILVEATTNLSARGAHLWTQRKAFGASFLRYFCANLWYLSARKTVRTKKLLKKRNKHWEQISKLFDTISIVM